MTRVHSMMRAIFVQILGGLILTTGLMQPAGAAGVVTWPAPAGEAVSGPHTPPSSFRGFDAEHGVDGVTIANLRVNGQPIRDAQAARLYIGPHVRQVRFN